MPRKGKQRPDVFNCATCGREAFIYRGQVKCPACIYRIHVERNKLKVRTCKFCLKDSTQVSMRPERNTCRPCHADQERERMQYKKFGYPPCEACGERPMVPKSDEMCTECFDLANTVDLFAGKAG